MTPRVDLSDPCDRLFHDIPTFLIGNPTQIGVILAPFPCVGGPRKIDRPQDGGYSCSYLEGNAGKSETYPDSVLTVQFYF